jgi:murein DD-endopeptidase MepM/ murein hydrolase activator NlpD
MIGRGSFGSRIKRSPSKKTEKEDKSNEEEAQFKAVEKSQQEKLIIKKIEVKDGPTDNGKDTCTITITTNRGVVEEEEFEAFTDIIGSKAVTEYGKSVPDSTKGKLGGDSKPVNGIDLKGAIINNKTVIRTNNSGIIEEIDKHNTETIVYLIPPIVTYSDNKNRNRTISIKGSINKKNDTTFEIFINSSTHSNNAQATQDNATVQENLNGSPLEEKKINSPPHVARRIEAKKDKEPKPHGGVDFKAKTGDKIYAVKAGKVHKIEYSTAPTGYGTQIVIKHDDGTFSRYAHMNGLVSKDDSVTMVSSENESYDVSTEIKEGQLIGFVGMTGFATGPHLHFEYYTKENATYMERAISTIDWLIENEGRGYTIVKNEEWEAIKKWRASGLGVEYAPVTGDESTNPGLNDYEVGKSKYKVNEDSSGNVTSVEYETVERELIGVDHYTDSPGFFLRYTEETGLNEKILFSVQKGSNDIIEKVIVMIPKNGLTLPDPNSMKFVEKKDGKIVVSGKVADYQNDPNYLIFDVDLGPESNVNKETVLTMTTESYFESNDGNTYSDYNFIFENKD